MSSPRDEPASVGLRRPLAAVVLVFALLAADRINHAYEHGGGHPIAYQDLTRELGAIQVPRASITLFKSRAHLVDFLRVEMPGSAPPPPPIDFVHREAYLIAVGPRSSSGYAVDVASVIEQRGSIVVTIRQHTPRLGDPVRPGVTYPFRLITLRRSHKPVHLVLLGP